MENLKNILSINQQKNALLLSKNEEIGRLIKKDKSVSEKTSLDKFSRIICRHFSMNFLSSMSTDELYDFIKKRFDFFINSLSQKKVTLSVLPYPSKTKGKKSSSAILEFAIHDRPFIADSITEHLHYKTVKLSLLIYPVISVEFSGKNNISTLGDISDDPSENYVYCCCIIEDIASDEMKDLKNRITSILEMNRCVTDDFKTMTDLVDEYSHEDEDEEAESLIESERRRLFSWFNEGNVIFLGSGEMKKKNISSKMTWKDIKNPLGYIRRKYELKDKALPGEIGRLGSYFLESRLKINIIEISEFSEIHRRDRIQLVFRKNKDKDGKISVSFFYILFTEKSNKKAAMAIPLARLKVNSILEKNIDGDSIEENQGHIFKKAHDFFDAVPKSELFRLDREELAAIFSQFSYFGDYQKTQLSTYTQPERRYARLTFCLPYNRFSLDIFNKIDSLLTKNLKISSEVKYWFQLGRNAYSHYIYWFPQKHDQLDSLNLDSFEQRVTRLTMGWEEEFQTKLKNLGKSINGRYVDVFDQFYQAIFTPEDAIEDIQFLELLLNNNQEQVDLRSDQKKGESVVYIFSKRKYNLTEIMPHMQDLGLIVIDENTNELEIESNPVFIYTYYVKTLDEQEKKFSDFKLNFCELLLAVLEENTENDVLNGLLLSAGLSMQEINLFILYRNYYWQVGAPYLPVNNSFLENPLVIGAILDYFTKRFDFKMVLKPLGADEIALLEEKVLDAIETVETVAEDIVFKTIFNLMQATIRTNYFNIDELSTMAIKVKSTEVKVMPLPHPLYEIYIHGTHIEGIHLRGAKVARGGLRHSDRPSDFRSEVLGLMNTQMLKNVVIVPEGSKGGFITKRSAETRQEQMLEVKKQYKIYINSLLSLTDNIVDGKVVPAKNIVRYDEDDPYLVVAADKGTATLSDTANEISAERGFWLQDAFASGGKHGYDHKGMAITARGAWECVKLHFLEDGKDIQDSDFSVVGIGDMSGDVFGNGMLLSKYISLRGAFNHIHIFVDPNPDIKNTYKERERLFDLPGSTWMDFDKKLISKGGGIFERSAKTIKLSPEIKKLLGVSDDSVSGETLIKLLLKCQVDLLWNGGIGTYVKASIENSSQVSDAANDAVRIDATQLRVKVIGEGGNLGLTQLARMECASRGIKLNTDAIDNSGGVDTSDHEVNMKILMTSLMAEKQIPSMDSRNKLLEKLTDSVADLVLVDNVSQGQVLSMDNSRSKKDVKPFIELINFLIEEKLLNPKTDNLSSRKELEENVSNGIGMLRPDLALLLSFSKMYFSKEILKSTALDDPLLDDVYYNYFPAELKKKYNIKKFDHPLKKEIIGTVLINKAINQAGVTLLPAILSVVDANASDIIVAYTIIDRIFNLDEYRKQVIAELKVTDINSAYIMLTNIEKFVRSIIIWMLVNLESKDIKFSLIKDLEPSVKKFQSTFRKLMDPDEERQFKNTCENLMTFNISQELAENLAQGEFLRESLATIFQAKKAKISLENAITLSQGINSMFHFNILQRRLMRLEFDSSWSKKHRSLLMRQLMELKQKATIRTLEESKKITDFDDKLQHLLENNKNAFKEYQIDYSSLINSDQIELSGLTILLQSIDKLLS